jgi:hypothetical protein
MLEGSCPLCGQDKWCGRPCKRDPRKSNALLFHPDGREKTLKERGLGWHDPPPAFLTKPLRKHKPSVALLEQLEAVTGKPHVTKKRDNKSKDVTKNVTENALVTKKRGRPLSGKATTSADRMRALRARRQSRPD